MRGPNDTPSPSPLPDRPESYARAVGNLAIVLAALVALGIAQLTRPSPKPKAAPAPPLAAPAKVDEPLPVVVAPTIAPAAPVAPQLDRAAVAAAEEEVETAHRERSRAEARLAEAKGALSSASTLAADRALSARALSGRIKDPTTRLTRASARSNALRSDRDRLKAEIAALAKAPRPKGKPLIDKSPVARPADGEEFHFEVRRNRIAAIDLERLLIQVKVDARQQLHRTEGMSTVIRGKVGPIGAFSMSYELGRSINPLDFQAASYGLQAWEIVPEREGRGESIEDAINPASDFTRAVNRLNPQRATVTLWVYPDSFTTYRKAREVLHAKGFQVAARPMPEAMPIRGSPTGTVSAGQ